MKQLIIILLLFTSIAQGQTTLANKLKILTNETSTTATKVNVQESNGLINTIAKADLIEVLEYSTAAAMPVTGVSGKIYVTIDSRKLYRWNGTIYQELAALTYTPENLANKQNSLTVDGTGVKYSTVDAVNTGLSSKIGGSGTTGTLPVFTASGVLGNSLATQTATDINVNGNIVAGTSSPVSNVRAFFESSQVNIPTLELRNPTSSTGFAYAGIRFTPNFGYFQFGKLNNNSSGYKPFKAGDSFFVNSNIGNIAFFNDRVGSGNVNFTVNAMSTPSLTIEASGNSLFKTSTDNGIDAIQVPNGTISALPATLSNQVVVKSQLDLKANIASPTFTGVPSVPTAAAGTNTTQIASTAFVIAEDNWSKSGSDIVNKNSGKILINNSPSIARVSIRGISNDGTGGISLNTALGTDWRIFASDNNAVQNGGGAKASMHISADPATGYGDFWTGGIQRSVSNSFQSPSSDISSTIAAFRGVTGQTGDYLQVRSNRTVLTGDVMSVNSLGLAIMPIATNALITSESTGKVLVTKDFSNLNRMIAYTVATLPNSPTQGDSYMVTDATSPTYLGSLTGGGTVKCPVFFNGTIWVSH